MFCQELFIILLTYLIMLWSMVVIMFGYKQVEMLLENVAEILVVLLIYCWFNYCVQLGLWSALTVCWLMNINIWETQFYADWVISLVPVLGGNLVTD